MDRTAHFFYVFLFYFPLSDEIYWCDDVPFVLN